MNILASDDGHGVISFNTSEHFILKEPTSLSGLSESVATLYVVRNPEDGTFGTVTAQFTISDANGDLADADLRPAQGFVVLEDGVRFKVRVFPTDSGFVCLFFLASLFLNVNCSCFRWWRSGQFLMVNLK